jgi:hypothetical protein
MKSYILANLARTGEQHLFNDADFKSFKRKLPTKANPALIVDRIAEMMRLNNLGSVCVKASNEVELFHEYLDSIYFEGKAEQLAAESPEEYSLLLNDYLHGRF